MMEIGETKIKDISVESLDVVNPPKKRKKILLAYWSSFTINKIAEQSK